MRRTVAPVGTFRAAMLTALTAALVVTGCAAQPACLATPRAASPRAAFLWRAEKAGAVIWLYGTIHAAGIAAVPDLALDALARSPRLVTELGAVPVDPDTFRQYARARSGPGIDHRLPADDWYDLRDALRGVIAEDDLRRAAPWYAMTLLTTHSGPTPGPSMDSQLVARARDRDQPVEALETWEDQLMLLASVVQLGDLRQAIRARKTMRCDLVHLRGAYDAGDTQTMTALLVVPRTAESMLYARNRAWLPRIEGLATRGGGFVAVGLGHLLGDQGLPALLGEAGFTVERVGAP